MELTGATKVCGKCNIEKGLEKFHKDKTTKSGYYPTCKECKKEYRGKPEVKKSESINKKLYYIDNVNKINERNNLYYIKTKETRKIKRKTSTNKWSSSNPSYQKTYYENNKENYKEYQNKHIKNNPHSVAWRNLLRNCLTRMGQQKEGYTIDILGYSALELQNHMIPLFTEGMSWDNHGEWHIDHVRRVSEFDKDTLPSIVNALTNLQPLWATTREINGIIYEGNLNKG